MTLSALLPATHPYRRRAQRFRAPRRVVAETNYSHFPSSVDMGDDGVGVVWFSGRAHGQSDEQAIANSQKPAAGGVQNLTIDGNWASGGTATVLVGTRVGITSDADDSARVFTITGTLAGVPVEYTVTGVNDATVYTTSGQRIDTVTQVSVDGNTTGNVKAGFWMLPADVMFSRTVNGGRSFLPPVKVFDGTTTGATLYYIAWIWRAPSGRLVAWSRTVDIATVAIQMSRAISDDNGATWTQTDPASWDVDAGTSMYFYGPCNTLSDGRLVLAGYNASGVYNWALISDDEGQTFTGELIHEDIEGDRDYSECSIACIDDDNWVAVTRIDGVTSAWRQFKRTVGGVWENQGATNLIVGGGYAGPRMSTRQRDGVTYVDLAYCIRDSSSNTPPLENAIYIRTATATDALAASTNWSEPRIIARDLTASPPSGKRHGYQDWIVKGQSILAFWGEETTDTTFLCRVMCQGMEATP